MSLSKSEFYGITGVKCALFHPWNESCIGGNLDLLFSTIIGVNQFYNTYYFVQLFLKRKRLSKGYLKYLFKGLIQSTIFGVFMANVFVLSNCLQLRMFGRLHYYSCLISATLGGLGVFFENPNRRGVAIVTFINMALELFVNQLRDSNILTKNRNIEVLLFMISSAIFMYYLRTDLTIKQTGGPYVWFYTPPTFPYSRKESETHTNNQGAVICPHEGTCWNDIMKAGARYFGIGTCFQILPIIIKHGSKMLKSPSFAGSLIFKRRNVYFGLFLACYVATFKAMSCALCHYQGFDSPLHALPAGFIAGLAYIFQPNLSILMAVISNLLMIGGRHFRNSQQLPDLPYGELSLALCNGLLYHSRIFHPQCCPGFLINMIDSCTCGKSALLYSGFKQATSKHLT